MPLFTSLFVFKFKIVWILLKLQIWSLLWQLGLYFFCSSHQYHLNQFVVIKRKITCHMCISVLIHTDIAIDWIVSRSPENEIYLLLTYITTNTHRSMVESYSNASDQRKRTQLMDCWCIQRCHSPCVIKSLCCVAHVSRKNSINMKIWTKKHTQAQTRTHKQDKIEKRHTDHQVLSIGCG